MQRYAPRLSSSYSCRGLQMKFGKRLAAEASRRWTESYFDYKAIKKAIKDDVSSKGTSHMKVHEQERATRASMLLVSKTTTKVAFTRASVYICEKHVLAVVGKSFSELCAYEYMCASCSANAGVGQPDGGPSRTHRLTVPACQLIKLQT